MSRAAAVDRTSLSPRELARALGVSESSVKRWVDDGALAAARTQGGHRRIPLKDAVRFIRKRGVPVVHPELLTGARVPEPLSDAGDRDRLVDVLHDALAGDAPGRGREVILALFLSGWPVAEIFDGPVRGALARIGERWRHDTLGVVVEHRATDACIGALAELRALVSNAGPDAPLALGGALAGDPYLLPSFMASITLADQGYVDKNLGPDTPLDALLAAVAHYRPALVWLTSSVPDRPAGDLSRALHALADAVAEWGGDVVFGGRSLRAPPRLPERVHHLPTMRELAAFARALRLAARTQ